MLENTDPFSSFVLQLFHSLTHFWLTLKLLAVFFLEAFIQNALSSNIWGRNVAVKICHIFFLLHDIPEQYCNQFFTYFASPSLWAYWLFFSYIHTKGKMTSTTCSMLKRFFTIEGCKISTILNFLWFFLNLIFQK